jgi:raffinose/stachyose/melibiose transport system permease protein
MDFIKAFGNSLFITLLSTCCNHSGSHGGILFHQIKQYIFKSMFALMAASMIIPFQAIMIPLVSIYGAGLNVLNHRLP